MDQRPEGQRVRKIATPIKMKQGTSLCPVVWMGSKLRKMPGPYPSFSLHCPGIYLLVPLKTFRYAQWLLLRRCRQRPSARVLLSFY